MMLKNLFFLVNLPILTGALLLVFRRNSFSRNLAQAVLVFAFFRSIFVLMQPAAELNINLIGDFNLTFVLNALSKITLFFVNFFGLLFCWYLRGYLQLKERKLPFAYLAWLVAFSNLLCLSGDFITFIFSWGTTLVLLYAFLSIDSPKTAFKALAIVGFGDFSLLLGICLYIYGVGTTQMPLLASVSLDSPLRWASFLLMLCGAFAKAGCVPLHTWIPAAAETTSAPIMAILPASLDKLIGIYLLARICVDFFILNAAALGILLFIGAVTIIFAVMMALIQHDLRKLLSYHAISQVGYMVLGFGTGTPIGIVAAIFHMINNCIYKSGLFLTGASVAQECGTYEMDKLGALAKIMPLTFSVALVFALSISGVPPLNGFSSKWMLYQGTIQGLFSSASKPLNVLFVFALFAALFGSVLTLASFIKFIHAVFLGEDSKIGKSKQAHSIPVSMKLPLSVFAVACIFLGLFPKGFVNKFIGPYLGQNIIFIGTWNSLASLALILFAFFLGYVLYKNTKTATFRQDDLFIGGEEPVFNPQFPATEFYKTVQELPLMKRLYLLFGLEAFDLYNILEVMFKASAYILFACVDRALNLITESIGFIVNGFSWVFRKLHTGVLDFYMVWYLTGLLIILSVLMAGMR